MSILVHLFSILVGILSFFYLIFHNYPPPPVSPIVFQWNSMGNFSYFKEFKIFYIDEHVTDGNRTLLCLHGFPTSSFDFYKILPKLRHTFDRLIFIDFLGMGYSDKPINHEYSIKEQADVVESVCNYLNVDKVSILSHDYGDTVAQELLARIGDETAKLEISSVTMLNGGLFSGIYQPMLIQKVLRIPIVGFYFGYYLSNSYLFSNTLSKLFGPTTQPNEADFRNFWLLVRVNNGYRVFSKLLTYIDERQDQEDRWVSILRSTKVPIQFIYGPIDPVNPKPFRDYYYKFVPHPEFYQLDDNIGHYPHYEVPEKVNELISLFLQKHGL